MLLAAVPVRTGGDTTAKAEQVTAKTNSRIAYRFIKRAFDIVAALILTAICIVPMVVISLVIICKDPGNPFYIHKRIGQNGREIGVLKFRTMRHGADDLEIMLTPEQLEEYRHEFKLRDDPRLIGYKGPGDGKRCFGEMLRKSSLDELPQIFYNVLIKGDMSFVGPRPVMREELEKYYAASERDELLSAKPGITGYWQTHGRSDSTYETGERQEQELYYVRHRSLWLDIKIFFKTFAVVARRGGTY